MAPGAPDWLSAMLAAINASLFCCSGGRRATLLSYLVNPRMTIELSTGQRLLGAVGGVNNSASNSRSLGARVDISLWSSASSSASYIKLLLQERLTSPCPKRLSVPLLTVGQ